MCVNTLWVMIWFVSINLGKIGMKIPCFSMKSSVEVITLLGDLMVLVNSSQNMKTHLENAVFHATLILPFPVGIGASTPSEERMHLHVPFECV